MPAAETRLFIALYLDADVDQELANQLRKRGFDAVSARDCGKYKNSDQEQLDFAASEQRAILSFNIDHFTTLYEEYWNAHTEHYGIIVSKQIPLGELLRRLLKFLDTVSANEMRNNYKNLGEFS